MSVRDTGGLTFGSVPACLFTNPSTVLMAAKLPNATVAETSGLLFSAYHVPSDGQHGWRNMRMAFGYPYGKERGNNFSAPDGEADFSTGAGFGQYNTSMHNRWLWWELEIVNLGSRVLRMDTSKVADTKVLGQAPLFTKVSVAETLNAEIPFAQLHFLNQQLSDAQWTSLMAGTLDLTNLTNYVDGFSFKDSLASNKGTMTLTAGKTPTYVADDPAFFTSGGGGTPAPSGFTIYSSGMV